MLTVSVDRVTYSDIHAISTLSEKRYLLLKYQSKRSIIIDTHLQINRIQMMKMKIQQLMAYITRVEQQ